MKKFYIIDGHALCYRAYYAFINNPLFNSKGENTSAIYGFFRMLLKLIDTEKPDYLAVAFDPTKKSFRFNLYEEYKANRQKMPDDLRSQIEQIKDMVRNLEIPVIINDEYEADDVLGTVAKRYGSEDIHIMLVTGDKDSYQLVNDYVSVYANTKGISEYDIYDSEKVKGKLGVAPNQVVDYMALIGDSADNIPGVKGIGPKSAEKLIQEFGDLDNIYKNIESLKGKQREKIESEKDMAYLSKDLVTIRTDIDLNSDLNDMVFNGINEKTGADLFLSMDMKSIADDYFGNSTNNQKSINNSPNLEKKYEIIKDIDSLNLVVSKIKGKKLVSVDTETTSLQPVDAEIVGVSFSIEEGQGWYLPLQNNSLFNEENIQISLDDALKTIKPVLEDESIRKIGQNIKYDIIIFNNYGIELNGIYFDTMVADYLVDPSRRHNMDDMAMFYLNYKTITFKELVGVGKKAMPITEVPLNDIAEYAIEDTDITLRLYNILKVKLEEKNLEKLFYELEMPLVKILARIEMNGVRLNIEDIKKLGLENDKRLNEVEQAIYSYAEEVFNINSTKELSRILFEKLGLPVVRKTKTGFSTDISVLEELKGKHDIVENLISYRTLNKLKTSYIDTLPLLVSPKTGKIHTSYNQAIVATGRLSSSDPNLQQIPIKDDFGKNIRKAFVAAEDSYIMSVDYSQIELRLAAHFSEDENMIKAFKEGIDIHTLTASSVFGVSIDKVETWMRRQAKIINFATLYGVSPYGLSQQADISVSDAKIFIDKYFETYPGMRNYIERMTEFAEKNGYVETLWGRRRNVPGINEKNRNVRDGAVRIAINTPIQGTSADMIKLAMINIDNEINKNRLNTKMILQVHDELVFEVPMDEMKKVEIMIKEKMEGVIELLVPVIAEIGWGKNWEEAH